MFHSSDVLQLRDGEQIKGIIRRHVFTLWPKLFLAGLLIVIPFFFLFTLLSLGTFGVILLAVTVALGIFFALKSFIQWDAKVLLLTSQRLIHVDQKGLWTRKVQELPLKQIEAVDCERKGLRDWFCRTATVSIVSGGGISGVSFEALPRYKTFMALLDKMKESTVRRLPENDIRWEQ